MARPREPWKRERILDAAVEVMGATGPSALKVVDVAQAAGVSTGTVHYHFSDIEGVFLGVVERAFDQMYHQRLAVIEPLPSIPAKLRLLIDLGAPDTSTTELTMMYEGIGMMRSRPGFTPLVKSYVERQVGLYRSVVDAGIHAGVFSPAENPGTIARNLLAMEDAYDMYLALGIVRDGAAGRAGMVSYCRSALGVDLDDPQVRQEASVHMAQARSTQADRKATR